MKYVLMILCLAFVGCGEKGPTIEDRVSALEKQHEHAKIRHEKLMDYLGVEEYFLDCPYMGFSDEAMLRYWSSVRPRPPEPPKSKEYTWNEDRKRWE